MKWLTLLSIAVAGMMVLSLPGAFTASAKGVAIESISHKVASETDEELTFKMSGQAGTKIFIIKGDNPRLVIDFPNTSYAGKGTIPLAQGKLATIIRTGQHQAPEQKTRVVVDLNKQIPVRYTSTYSETNNILTVQLLSDAEDRPQKEAPPIVAAKQEVVAPPQADPNEVVIAKPVEKKPVPPPFPPQEPTKKPVVAPVTQTPAPGKTDSPKLLGISFDDTSDKGEMVLFHLSAFLPPTVSAVEKDNPRVFCDFLGMELSKGVEENIVAKGKYVERISTSKPDNSGKIRVVLNLIPSRDYDLQQVFFKNDNLFVLIVNELPPEKLVP